MDYRCEAKTARGFVQQFACCYVLHGFFHYVVGQIPKGKDPEQVDRKMVERFGCVASRFVRARRKRAGLPNTHYIRFKRFFVLCSTGPRDPKDAADPFFAHPFYLEHSSKQRRDIRRHPLAFAGYSIGYHRGVDRQWHVSIRIHPERYKTTKAYLLEAATKLPLERLVAEFQALRFEPYAPIRRQFLMLRAAVNAARKRQGLELLPMTALRLRRKVVRPFGFEEAEATRAELRDAA